VCRTNLLTMPVRCEWSTFSDLALKYHDEEWGVPVHDDRSLFEFLVLEGAQAGLSWETILRKRDNYRKAFDNFDFEKVATYDDAKVDELLKNEGIIRNRLKVRSAINNAQAFKKVRDEFGSFDTYVWDFVNQAPVHNSWKSLAEIPAKTEIAEKISKDLRKSGFNFVGPTIIYAFMQAVGMVNDHVTDCFRHEQCRELGRK
jgi:DNA-3-methyladenine glycosylase I